MRSNIESDRLMAEAQEAADANQKQIVEPALR
jgi:hypothetical protein